MEPRVAVAISAWEDEALLAGAAESVRPTGWPVVYAEGAYELYLRRRVDGGYPPWRGRPEAARAVLGASLLSLVPAPEDAPWPTEAAKKTVLAAEALRLGAGDWLFYLDADERVELPGGPEGLRAWWKASVLAHHLWLMVDRVEPTRPDCPRGQPLPRLIRLLPGLAFRPPRDFDAFLGDERVAYHDGDRVPERLRDRWLEVPGDVLRLVHLRHLRQVERTVMSGEYAQRRRPLEGW